MFVSLGGCHRSGGPNWGPKTTEMCPGTGLWAGSRRPGVGRAEVPLRTPGQTSARLSLSCCWVRPVCWLVDAPCHSPPLASHGLPFVHGHQSHWTEGPPCSSRADWPLLYLQRPCFPIRPHGQVVRGRTRTRLSGGTNVNQEWWVPQHGSSTDQVFPKRSPFFQTQGRGRPAPTP